MNANKSSISLKRLFNYDFSTIMLFRCLPKRYALDFIKGKIKFGQPDNWIKEEEKGNKGRGDLLEGVMFSTTLDDNTSFINNIKSNVNFENFSSNNLLYFRNKHVRDLYCLCLYSLNDNVFTNKEIDRFGEEHMIAKVSYDYFLSFSYNSTKENYFELDENDRQTVIFISNPKEFSKRIRSFFKKFDVSENDILIYPVNYIDLKIPFFIDVLSPLELFVKDQYYKYQSEYRVVINSINLDLINYLKENNGVIDIGDISDIAYIHDYYFNDLILEKRNNVIYYNLPFPKIEEITKLKDFLSLYRQIYNDRQPYEMSYDERRKTLKELKKDIEERFNIEFIMRDGEIVITSGPYNLKELLED